MNKNEIKNKAHEMLSNGTSQKEVFSQLSGQGIKDSQLALWILSFANPTRCLAHDRKVSILVTLMFIQALLAFIVGYGIGLKLGPNAKWVLGALLAFLPLLFAWGFYKHKAGFYNVFIMLTLFQLPRTLFDFSKAPFVTSISLVLGLGLLAYVWYVRNKIFPGFFVIFPKKQNGEYVFSE